jgi:hypothetical protein
LLLGFSSGEGSEVLGLDSLQQERNTTKMKQINQQKQLEKEEIDRQEQEAVTV